MLEYLPFVIGLAYVVFKVRSEIKAQQVPQKKNPASGRSAIPAPSIPTVPSPRKTDPFLIRERADVNNPYESAYERDYKEEEYKPMRPGKFEGEPRPVYDYVKPALANYETLSDETRNERQIHALHQHGKLVRVEHKDEFGEESLKFDMKQAVIYDAILNKPEY